MTDNASDPIAGFNPSSPDDAREIGAALVRSGNLTVEQANAHLASRGATPLQPNSLEFAPAERERLYLDRQFVAKYLAGDVEAQTKLNSLVLRIEQGDSAAKVDDRDPQPGDYSFNTGYQFRDAPESSVQKYNDGLATFAASLKLTPEHAKAIGDMHLEAAAREARQKPEEREAYGREQEQLFARTLGPDGLARAQAAQDTLRQVSGRNLDLAAIVRSNGAELAINLIFQAEHLKATGNS
jgi:hypothetical protein